MLLMAYNTYRTMAESDDEATQTQPQTA